MPINIYIRDTGEKVAWLCDSIWDLPNQIHTLQTWLDENSRNIHPGKYVADIGFNIRDGASGGGGVLSSGL